MDEGQTARTVKSQYGKSSAANFVSQGTFGATAVIEVHTPKIMIVGNADRYRPNSKFHLRTRAWVYDPDGIAPTLGASDYKEARLIVERIPQNTPPE